MELEFQTRGLQFMKPLLREVQTQEQTQEVRLSDGMPDIGRVLGGWGQVILRGKEWRSDTVSFSGGVMVWILYAPEDGTLPQMLESWIPFQMRWDIDDGLREGDIRIQYLLRSVDARSVSARKIMIRCGIGALGEAYIRDTAQIAVPGELPEDVQLLNVRYPVRLPKTAGEKTFLLDEDLTMPGSAPVPEKLIAYTAEPKLTDTKVMSNKVVFRGGAQLHVVYLSEEGQVRNVDFELPFSQFADLEGEHSSDAQADIRMGITSLELELDGQKHLRLKCGLLAQFLVDDREMLELIEDAYSPARQVEPEREMLELPMILEQRQVPVAVNQTVNHAAGEIADVTYLPDFPRVRRGDGVQMEVPGQFQVLYYDTAGLQGASARSEENWQMLSDEGSRVDATVLPGALPAASAGESISLKGESVLHMTTTSRQGISMVTGLELGDRKETDSSRPSVILRRAGDARLWDIAKSTGSTVEAIKKANGLDSEPAVSQILLIPVS